jgi:prepilin-type N-terminal cleavage/methylation domain-containing protein
VRTDAAWRIAHWPSRRAGAGFGLLEVLVSLAILALVGGALFSWINQSLDSARRLQRSDAEAQLTLNVQALLSDLNPLREPEGKRELAGIKVSWNSTVVQPVVDGRSFVEGQFGDWRIGLFAVSVDAEDLRSRTTVRFDILKTGLQPRLGAGGAAARETQ